VAVFGAQEAFADGVCPLLGKLHGLRSDEEESR
jgi:hypothetical protein